MIELPKVLTIARQMNDELREKRIASVVHNHTPHKFAMYNEPPGGYEAVLAGKTMGEVTGDGKWIFGSLDQERVLLLGELGGRILFHRSEDTLPKKHQLLLHFEDETFLTITIQMWGFIQVVTGEDIIKYGEVIGAASDNISLGEWIHTYNLESSRVPTSQWGEYGP